MSHDVFIGTVGGCGLSFLSSRIGFGSLSVWLKGKGVSVLVGAVGVNGLSYLWRAYARRNP